MTKKQPAFEVAPWNNPFNDQGWLLFRVGTCHGQWRSTDTAYEILSVINNLPGNGDFKTTLNYFYRSCKRDKKDLVIREVWNKELKEHLVNKKGFKLFNKDEVIKKFT